MEEGEKLKKTGGCYKITDLYNIEKPYRIVVSYCVKILFCSSSLFFKKVIVNLIN